jgi:hypothetical protein
MLLQEAIGAGIGILFYGGLALLVFAPFISVLAYDVIKRILRKNNPAFIELKGAKKGLAIVASILLGIFLAILLIGFVIWFLLKDVTFD